jgi:two-component system sensor histidine kinase VanS
MIALVMLLIGGSIVAWLISGRMLRPLQSINRAAKLASTASFDHRVGLGGPRDELRDLSDTFDEMLSRLSNAFQAYRRFAANASHELRTPLAATQTMLEVALNDPDLAPDELREVSQRVLETNRRNIETVEALLDLAEIDRRPIERATVAVGRLVEECVSELRGEASSRNLTVEVSAARVAAKGDAVLLRQALSNLIRNAIRHNHDHGWVDARLTATAEKIMVRIENTGPVLSPAQVPELTEPFARGAGRIVSHAESVRGHGLGLTIVASVAEAHGGRLMLAPRDGGGLIVELELPAARPAAS